MSIRNMFTSILMTCSLVVGSLSVGPVANAASIDQSFLNAGERTENNVVKIKRRNLGQRNFRPIVPYIAYDYPNYYSRGFYPTHIGPGYVYIHGPVADRRGYDYIDDVGVPYSAIKRCSRRFRSFEKDTGLFTSYSGRKKLCPYLR